MFFDDRLATVLRHRATSERGARTQFRQLLDLLGSRKYGRDDSLLAAAWLRLGALGEQIPAEERARIVLEPGWRFRNVQLAAHLAEDEPAVASAALTRADLSEEEWVTLVPRLPIRARGFLRNRRNLPTAVVSLLEQLGIHDRGLPHLRAEDLDELELDVEAPPLPQHEATSAAHEESTQITQSEEKSQIAALVERIAQFRRENVSLADSDLSPRLPLEEQVKTSSYDLTNFAFESDTQGKIIWAESHAASMAVGQRLFDFHTLENSSDADTIADTIRQQQPIVGGKRTLQGAAAICGEWVIDAHPRFSRSGGRFHGHVGRFRRPFDASQSNAAQSESDRLRQLLHELRTPINAVQGFAELIHQQLYGPVPNAYRALAANIAGDAANILAGFDELERLAKLESGVVSLGDGKSDLVSHVQRTSAQLNQVLAPRMAGFEIGGSHQNSMWVGIDPEETEALIWRLLATLAGLTSTSEVLAAQIESDSDIAMLWSQIPTQLASEEDVFAAQMSPRTSEINAGLFGAGFSLRLARAEAKAAGGDLVQDEGRVLLTLPLKAVAGGSDRGTDVNAA